MVTVEDTSKKSKDPEAETWCSQARDSRLSETDSGPGQQVFRFLHFYLE